MMLGRIFGQNASGIAILAGMVIAIWAMGFWFGTMTVPGPPSPPKPLEQIRAEAIRRCFLDVSGRLNRNQPDPEALTNINQQCQRIYDSTPR